MVDAFYRETAKRIQHSSKVDADLFIRYYQFGSQSVLLRRANVSNLIVFSVKKGKGKETQDIDARLGENTRTLFPYKFDDLS